MITYNFLTTFKFLAMKTVLHYYSFDISNQDANAAYHAMCFDLKKTGHKLFDTTAGQQDSDWYRTAIIPLDG